MSQQTFRSLISSPTAEAGELLASLARDLASALGVPPDERDQELAAFDAFVELHAGQLAGATAASPAEQLAALHQVLAGRLRTEVPWRVHDRLADLRPECVVRDGRGHPLAVAAITLAVGRRARLRVGLAPCDGVLHLVHRAAPRDTAIAFGTGRLVGAAPPEARGRPLCTHQVATLLLDHLAARAELLGQRVALVRASELGTYLPVDAREAQRRLVELHRARAAWN